MEDNCKDIKDDTTYHRRPSTGVTVYRVTVYRVTVYRVTIYRVTVYRVSVLRKLLVIKMPA